MEKEQPKKMKTAVALSYEMGAAAPRIIASGRGYVADKIIKEGQKEEIPFYEDDKLANTLSKLEIGDYIPEELYGVVAEILVFVSDMDKIRSKIDL